MSPLPLLTSLVFGLLATLGWTSLRGEPVVTNAPPEAASVVTVAPPADKERFHLYVLMGQSNMSGTDTRSLASQQDNPRILSLNAEGQWVVARYPLFSASGAGPGISFASEMLKADPNLTIGLVQCAAGGSGLSRWLKGGDLYLRAIGRTNVAAQSGVIKGVLWHQGESNTRKQKDPGTYEARLAKMFSELRTELGLPELPIIVGLLGEFLQTKRFAYVDTVRAGIKHIPSVVPNAGFADSTGLGHKGDELHFTAEAQKEMGVRYAQAMQELQTKQPAAR